MPTELDILAIEPFYGGERRAMLETIVDNSRHRWTVLKLPARRQERRLATAAVWFAEVMSRKPVGNIDVVFATEMLNLADMYRLAPWLERKPAVMYFHTNQLPEPLAPASGALQLVNLNSALVANEIWFNSQFHFNSFLGKTSALVRRHSELIGRNPVPDLSAKSHIMQPAIDLDVIHGLATSETPQRQPSRMVVDTRNPEMTLLQPAMLRVVDRRPDVAVVTIGPPSDLPNVVMSFTEKDEIGSARALLESSIYVSARPGAPSDRQAVRALVAGCWPILPQIGVYPELLPEALHGLCLYESNPNALADAITAAWDQTLPTGFEREQARILFQYDPDYACREMDDRFEELALVNTI